MRSIRSILIIGLSATGMGSVELRGAVELRGDHNGIPLLIEMGATRANAGSTMYAYILFNILNSFLGDWEMCPQAKPKTN